MAVVKADAYGHGAPWIARAALDAGAAMLGVATVGEGQSLRAHGIDAPIVLLGSIDAGEAPAACEAGLEITVASEWLLDSVQLAARAVRERRRSRFISRSIPGCAATAPPPQRRFLSQCG